MDFSVVTLAWNRPGILDQFLDALVKCTLWDRGELIVVEQGSRISTRAIVARHLRFVPRYKLIQNHENMGIPRGRNQGIRAAEAEHTICCLDSDILVSPGWLKEIERLLTLPLAGCACLCPDPNILCQRREHTLIDEKKVPLDCARDAGWNVGGMICFSRSTQQKLGYFNEEYGPYGENDYDWGHRIVNLGLRNYYSDRMQSVHLDDGHDLRTNPNRIARTKELKRMREKICAEYTAKTRSLYVPFHTEVQR